MASNQGASGKSSIAKRLRGLIRLERPWFIIIGIALLLGVSLAAFAMYQLRSDPATVRAQADTQAVKQDVRTTPGGNATREYHEKMQEYNEKEAEQAKKQGKTYIKSALAADSSSDSGSALALDSEKGGEAKRSEQKRRNRRSESEGSENAAQQSTVGSSTPSAKSRINSLQDQIRQLSEQISRLRAQQNRQSQAQSRSKNWQTNRNRKETVSRFNEQMARLRSEMQSRVAKQKVVSLSSASQGKTGGPENQATSARSVSDKQDQSSEESEGEKPDLSIAPGDILYARNELRLNSDVGGPVQATILSGDLQGGKLMGGFKKKRGYLRVKFNRLVTTKGQQYSVKAFAIDPRARSTEVRSDIDRHMLQRWGGLMATSFLAGFGEAVSRGGSSVSVSDGTTTKAYPSLDLNKKLWSAAGKVGDKLASKFEENFDRPATVTLKPGQKLGVLIISKEN